MATNTFCITEANTLLPELTTLENPFLEQVQFAFFLLFVSRCRTLLPALAGYISPEFVVFAGSHGTCTAAIYSNLVS